MKKHLYTTLGCLLVSAMISHAQDSAAPAATTEAAAPAAVAETPVATTAVEAAPAAAPAEAVTAAPAAATDTNTTAAATTVASANNINDLIVIDDTPLLDAIRNLARTAGINLMIDPRVNYGQPGADGKIIPQPSVSIRWEKITAEQALLALLNNYGLQAVQDPKVQITRITIKDPAAPDPLVTRAIQLSFASPSNVMASVTASFTDKRSKVVADVRTSQLVVVATEKELVEVEKLVARLDTMTKQVLIEAKLYETSVNPKTVKGIDWSGTLNSQKFTFGNNPDGSVSVNDAGSDLPGVPPGLASGGSFGFNPAVAFLNADGVSAAFSFLNTSADAKVIATPRAVTLDNEMADLSVSRAYPIFKNTAGTQGSPGGSEVTYTNLGVFLRVTPRISANDFVNLRVEPEVSTVFDTIRKEVADTFNEADVYDIRRLNTTVLIPSGSTLVLGGLVRDSMKTGNIKVPLLGDLPMIGGAFRKDSKERDKSNLMIFITPTIVKESDYQAANSTFLKSKAEEIDDSEWSAWDSGKPRDWSKKGVKGGATKSAW